MRRLLFWGLRLVCALHQAANLHWRLAYPAQHYPLALWKIPAAIHESGRLDSPAALMAAAGLIGTPRCCLDRPLSCKVLGRHTGPHTLLQSSAIDCITKNAADITTCNLDLERMQARNRADNALCKTRGAPGLFTSAAVAVWKTEHRRLGGKCPHHHMSRAELRARSVKILSSSKAAKGARRASGFVLFMQSMSRKWQEKHTVRVLNRQHRAGSRFTPDRVRKKHIKPAWDAWVSYRSRQLALWHRSPDLRAVWQQRASNAWEEAGPPDELFEALEPEDANDTGLWGCGDKSTPVRLPILAELVERYRSKPFPSHPTAGRLVGPTSVARELAKEHEAEFAIGDPHLPGKLPELHVEWPCWQMHPGLCRTSDAAVFETVAHLQLNLNTLFRGE